MIKGGNKKIKISPRVKRREQFIKQMDTPVKKPREIDYRENFLYGFEKEDFEGRNPLLKRSFSLTNATDSQIMKFKIARAVEKYQEGVYDTGSAAVQVACLTEKIIQMTYHFKSNLKDYICLRKLSALYAQRNKILNYLRSKDPNRFVQVIKDYNISTSPNELSTFIHYKLPHKRSGMPIRRSYNDQNREKPDPFNQGRVVKFRGWTPRIV